MKTAMMLAAAGVCTAMVIAQDPGAMPPPTEPTGGERDETFMSGELLGPELLGQGIIETMDAAVARDVELRLAGPRNPRDRNGSQGQWVVPGPRALGTPHSGALHIANKWGDSRMGIAFRGTVDFDGAWIAGQGGVGSWAEGVRFVGFRDGVEVAAGDWMRELTSDPRWLGAGFKDVDRIEIHAIPVHGGFGYYGLDDLTFVRNGKRVVVDFDDCHTKQTLTGSDHAGLTWEQGTGDFVGATGVQAPVPIEEEQPEEIEGPPLGLGGGGTSPMLLDDFQGVIRGDAGQFSFPPDTCGAVGPNHFVEVVNQNFSVYNKATGVRVTNLSLQSFQPGSGGDPRVIFDVHSQKWIVISTNFSNRIYLAVSLSTDPTSTWFKTNFVTSAGSDAGCWPDFPTLGVSADGIFCAASMFGGGCGRTLWVIDKAPLVDGTPSLGAVTAFRSLSDSTIQPCVTYDATAPEYTISTIGNNFTQLRVRRVNAPITSPTLSIVGAANVPFHQAPNDAPAQGSSTNIDTGDRRIQNAVMRDGTIWCANTISISGRAGCQWYQIAAASATTIQTGQIGDASLHYYYPGISVNSLGDMVIGFSGSNSSQSVAAYYSGRRNDDGAGQTAPPLLLRSGNGSYNLVDNFGRNRWGDYSLTTVDPVDDLTFWTVQEYSHSTNTWGTQIAKFAYSFPPSNDDCSDAIPIPNGDTAFDTNDATLDGAAAEPSCPVVVGADVWYRIQTPIAGTLIASVCDADFDTVVGIYPLACPTQPGQELACDNDSCGSGSIAMLEVGAGEVYTIRVAGIAGATGSGTLNITVTPDDSCTGDLNDDGIVGTDDLLAILANWGTDGSGADLADPIDIVDTSDLLALLGFWGVCP